MKRGPILYCNDDSEIELPYKWCICDSCRGEGKSSAYLGAFTRDELFEEGSEFIEDYFAGRYDRACEACDGLGRIKEADLTRMSQEQRDAYAKQFKGEREVREIERQERLFEGGWREEGWFGR